MWITQLDLFSAVWYNNRVRIGWHVIKNMTKKQAEGSKVVKQYEHNPMNITKEYLKLDMRQRVKLLCAVEKLVAKHLKVSSKSLVASWTGKLIEVEKIEDIKS